MRKFLSILMVLALVTALFVSCSQDNVGSVVGEDLASVSFATGDSSRTLTVSREAFDENDYIWCYTATKADNSGMTQGQTTEEQYVWGDNHTKTGLTGATIEGISQGLWNFTLRAYVPVYEGETITGKSDVMAWFGSVTNQPVRKGEANVVNVTVSAVVDPTKEGIISFKNVVVRKLNETDVTALSIWTGDKDLILGVKATTLAGAAVDGAFVEYKKGEGHTPSNIPEPKFEVAAGTYFVTFKAYEGTFAEPTFVYAEETIAVNVYSGLRTIISGFVSELSSYVQFGEPVANAVIEAQTNSVIDVDPEGDDVDFNTDSTQSTSSYQAASIPAEAVYAIKGAVVVPPASTLTDLALALNVEDKGSTDASATTTKKFEISLDAIVTTTDESSGAVNVDTQRVDELEDIMVITLYIGKNLTIQEVWHDDTQLYTTAGDDGEFYAYDSTEGILTLHVIHFSPFSVIYEKEVAVARLIKADGTGSDFYTLEEAVDAAAKGDTVKLLKDIDLSAQIVVTEELTLDLNGQKLYNTNDLWVGDSWSLISVRAGGDLTITGNGTLDPKENDCYAIDVKDGAKLDVKNGTFFGNITVIYAYDGFVTVEGGTFDLYQLSDEATDKYRFMLNCLDEACAAGDAWFTVTGGTFFNFNPADNQSEGPHTNYVPAGYDVVVEGNLYTVVPYVGEGVVVNMTSVPRTYYKLVDGKLADLNGYLIPEQDLPAKTDELVLLNSSLANSVDVSIDNFNAGYTWTAIHSETEPDYGKQYFEGGWGTRIEPYLIADFDQWNSFYQVVYDWEGDEKPYFKLTADIDCEGQTIKNYAYDAGEEVYRFDMKFALSGDGYTVKKIEGLAGNCQLFPYIWDASISDITIDYNLDEARTIAMAYNSYGSCEFINVNTTGRMKTSANWASAFVVYPFDTSDNGLVKYINCKNYADLTTNYTSSSYVAPFGSHTMSIKSVVLENCENHGTIAGGHASAFVGMTGGNSSRYTVSGLKNYGKIYYSESGNLFTYGNHTLNNNVVAKEGSSIEKTPTVSLEISDDNHLVIKGASAAYDYRVSMSVPVQMYGYNGNNSWSGAFPRKLTKTYSQISGDYKTDFMNVDVLEMRGTRYDYSGEHVVPYYGIFAAEDMSSATTIISNLDEEISLVSYDNLIFYYFNETYESGKLYHSLVTTANGAETGSFNGNITVTLSVEALLNGDVVSSGEYKYSFSVADASQIFD